MSRIHWMAALVVATAATACTNMTPQQESTTKGAAVGAVAGAGIAAISGGSGWTGAAVGAVVGGVAGNIKGGKQQ